MLFPSFLILALCLVTGVVPLKISEIVVPNAVEVGEDAELSCAYILEGEKETSLYVKWWWTANDDKRQIYQRFGGNQGQIIKQDYNITMKGGDSLILSGLEPEHSGVYECEVFAYPGEAREHLAMVVYTDGSGAQLKVIDIEEDDNDDNKKGDDKDGDDDDDDDEDMVLVECEAIGVSPAPEFLISMNGVALNDSKTVSGPKDGLFNITGSIKVSKDDADGAEFTCELFFNDHTVPHPVYSDTYMYKSGGNETTIEDHPSTTDDPDSTTDDPPGDSSTRLDNPVVLTTLLIAFTFGNRW